MSDPHMSMAVLVRRQRAIAATITQICFGIASAAVAFDRDAISGMVFGPLFALIACGGLYGAVNLKSVFILGHFMLVTGAVFMCFAYSLMEFFVLGDDRSDELLMITSIPLVFDVMFAAFSGHLYWAYAHGAEPGAGRRRLLSQGSVRSRSRSVASSVPDDDNRPPFASPVMPSRIEVSFNGLKDGDLITG